mmetsp:Transcript_12843/g.22151  ORF Transcript_12843/g.22151 Transcript_12843/m.22151 type:complete len:230 (+) Transcript_12843:67-756(+)
MAAFSILSVPARIPTSANLLKTACFVAAPHNRPSTAVHCSRGTSGFGIVKPMFSGSINLVPRPQPRVIFRSFAVSASAEPLCVDTNEGQFAEVLPGIRVQAAIVAGDSPSVTAESYMVVMEPGSTFFWHDHPVTEYYMGLEGEGIITVASGTSHVLKPGVLVQIPPNTANSMSNTGDKPWKFLNFAPNEAPGVPVIARAYATVEDWVAKNPVAVAEAGAGVRQALAAQP